MDLTDRSWSHAACHFLAVSLRFFPEVKDSYVLRIRWDRKTMFSSTIFLSHVFKPLSSFIFMFLFGY